MSSPAAARILRSASRHSSRLAASASARTGRVFSQQVRATAITRSSIECARCFSTTLRYRAGLMPDQEDPQPPSKVETERTIQQPTDISEETYQIRADEYMEAINEKAEAIQEAREDVEVEYSAGVLSITLPRFGTYIINKQPPNKQIWLSSPISGPKRYDYVLGGEGMHEKEGTGMGDWIYLRDGSSLTELLRKEVGITVDLAGHDEALANVSKDAKE